MGSLGRWQAGGLSDPHCSMLFLGYPGPGLPPPPPPVRQPEGGGELLRYPPAPVPRSQRGPRACYLSAVVGGSGSPRERAAGHVFLPCMRPAQRGAQGDETRSQIPSFPAVRD